MTAAAVEPLDVATLSLDAFRDRPVVVLGFARSGVALARFLADQGARVTVYDVRSAAELGESVAALRRSRHPASCAGRPSTRQRRSRARRSS